MIEDSPIESAGESANDRDSWEPEPNNPQVALNLERITEVLVAIASGNFDVRAPRSHDGGPWDVLAFLANETAEEVHRLVDQLHQERLEREEAQERLHHAEKLAALGELAGGVAHELNQPLTVMQTLAELLLQKPEKTIEERRREIELIGAATRRMGRIVSAIRTFGRQAPLNLKPVNVEVPLNEALSLLDEPLHSARVEVQVEVAPDAPQIQGDEEALQQVFINLLSNARDILEDQPEGQERKIAISVGGRGGRAKVLFDDNGPGVPPDVAEKLFDPFFSTKSVGRGTGLGLSICHGIIMEHAGTLTYEPSPMGGARFVLEFPSEADLK